MTGSLLVATYNEKVLICYNKLRKQWEQPAGGIDKKETPRDCIIRELYEETCQEVNSIMFIGLAKIYDSNRDIIKFQALYYTVLEAMKPFCVNDEMEDIYLWDLKMILKNLML